MYQRKFVNQLASRVQELEEHGDWERALGGLLQESPLAFKLYRAMFRGSWDWINSIDVITDFLRVLDTISEDRLQNLELSAHEIILILEETESV